MRIGQKQNIKSILWFIYLRVRDSPEVYKHSGFIFRNITGGIFTLANISPALSSYILTSRQSPFIATQLSLSFCGPLRGIPPNLYGIRPIIDKVTRRCATVQLKN